MKLAPTSRWQGQRTELFLLEPDSVSADYVSWLNDPAVNRFLESRWSVATPESTREFVAQQLASPSALFLGIRARALGARHVGNIKLGPIDRKMGQRGGHTCDVIFEDARVPAANIIGGKEGMGFKTAMKVLDKARLNIAAVCVGVAERMLDDALGYALQRRQFGRPVAEFQLVQAMLADCRTEIFAARSMTLEAARKHDAGERIALEASCCKYFASEMCGRVADRAVQIHGGAGYMADYGIERFYRDVRLFRIFEGTSQIQQLVIARNMIKAAGG